MPLTYAQIRTFNAVVREGSFTAAARELGVSQPAVTAQIKAIEETYDVQLFERSSKKLVSTELARTLFATTERVDDVERDAEEILTTLHGLERGELRVISNATPSMVDIISVFANRYPGVRITARNGDDGAVIQAIDERKADVAVMTNSPRGERFTTIPFRHHRLTALVPRSHRFAARAMVKLSELLDEPVVYRMADSGSHRAFSDALLMHGLTLDPVLVVETRETMLMAVSAGIGIGIMFSGTTVQIDGIVHVPIVEIPDHVVEDVFCLRLHSRRRSIAAFLSVARELADTKPRGSKV
ncbi:LysR family transcriptional regulator [Breoghania corrubedonensis]|uniref:LysR family transcriptional regulator n=1 Tax=Breoghania corrubedonensis TaxID=665038 RepID=A0A2T5VEH3_9HYPH|nr:LysR family transcriptional regulator [Breoghania corrubedonensis]PTW62155.1 LysR family transcriptional regulator [Breoghania corrubedonensis]